MGENMTMPPKGRIEWNLNTIIMLIGFVAGIVTWGISIGIFVGKVSEIDAKFTREIARIDSRHDQRITASDARWREHDQLHRDRNAENAARDAKSEERFRVVEQELRKIDNLTYRLTVQEASTATLTRTVEEIKTAIGTLASDVRIVREILQRDGAPDRKPP